MKKLLKIVAGALGALLTLVILVWGGLNLLKFPIYGEYYSVKADVCENPGLNDGFVCQGISYAESAEKLLVSGYMTDKSASRIYVTDTDNNSYFVTLASGDKAYKGHVGGIATHGDSIYLSCSGAIHIVKLADVLSAENADAVQIQEKIPVNNNASFIYASDTHLYVGEFHDGGAYVTEHPYETSDGLYHAIISRYSFDDLTKPDRVYSIRDKVQGVCFAEGKVVLSTSYGLTSSVYYVYNESDAENLGVTLDGAPVYGLVNCRREVSGPAMAEGLDLYDGKVITLTESASNKYIFGKFFFATKIVGLDILGE